MHFFGGGGGEELALASKSYLHSSLRDVFMCASFMMVQTPLCIMLLIVMSAKHVQCSLSPSLVLDWRK